ncbi:hypothetical protein HZH68_016234 [Vespula germanica]|uniref:Uncharacterized protein n=1 Tax=Vespula germanica TaxID=30212 RepID=A0A834J4M6_VESGE|nr:hypothetical protein HZH68_016234 [Vespula germanica]
MDEIENVKENPGAINKDSKNEDLLIYVEEEKEEKGDKGDEDVQGTIKGLTDLFHINVTLTSLFHQIKLSNHLLKLKIDDMLNQSSKDIVFHAPLPDTLREVDIPYTNVKKRGRHNSKNH